MIKNPDQQHIFLELVLNVISFPTKKSKYEKSTPDTLSHTGGHFGFPALEIAPQLYPQAGETAPVSAPKLGKPSSHFRGATNTQMP